MKTIWLLPVIGLFLSFSSCSGDKSKDKEENKTVEKETVSKQFYVNYEQDGKTVIMQSDDASCGYAYANSTGMYNVDMSYEYSREGDVLKQVNFGFYIEDKSMLNAEGLVGKSFPVRLNIFHRDMAGNAGFIYQRSTDFADNQGSSCTFVSFEQIGDSRYYLAKGTFSCVLSDMEETESIAIKDGRFAMKIKP